MFNIRTFSTIGMCIFEGDAMSSIIIEFVHRNYFIIKIYAFGDVDCCATLASNNRSAIINYVDDFYNRIIFVTISYKVNGFIKRFSTYIFIRNAENKAKSLSNRRRVYAKKNRSLSVVPRFHELNIEYLGWR